MNTFIDFLTEIGENRQTVVLSGPEVERLVQRFGPLVRSIGLWNSTGHGSVEVPMSNVTEAARTLGLETIAEAVVQLRDPDQFTTMLKKSSAAAQLIDSLHVIYLRQFHDRVKQYQNSQDPADLERLRNELSRDLFGS